MLQPHSQGHRSYFEAFKRRRNATAAAAAVDVLNRDEILTDRGAYLSFLEVQLERVSRACVATQELGHRIDVFAAKATAAEEKVGVYYVTFAACGGGCRPRRLNFVCMLRVSFFGDCCLLLYCRCATYIQPTAAFDYFVTVSYTHLTLPTICSV